MKRCGTVGRPELGQQLALIFDVLAVPKAVYTTRKRQEQAIDGERDGNNRGIRRPTHK